MQNKVASLEEYHETVSLAFFLRFSLLSSLVSQTKLKFCIMVLDTYLFIIRNAGTKLVCYEI